MEPGIIIKKIAFAEDSQLPLEAGSITVITGPNNSGKSTSLRDLDQHFGSLRSKKGYQGAIIRDVETELVGTAKDFLTYFDMQDLYDKETDRYKFKFYSEHSYKPSTIRAAVAKNKLPNPIESTFKKFLPAHERLSSQGYRDSIDHAADQLYSDEAREIALSSLFQKSFGIDLILNRTRTQGAFHIGERSELLPHDRRFTPEFRLWMDKLPTLREQGDGMRSFTRVLIEIFVKRLSILAIDEPELFLHPPQIRQIVELIVKQKPKHSQVFIATHSDEVVRGLLNANPEDINFIRLTRTKNQTSIGFLRNVDVGHLWSDPLLRTSNALSSLFHNFTILCEGESDARFIRWALDERMRDEMSIDYFITHCGSKQKMHSIVTAIRSIGAEVLSVCDIDILNDKPTFRRMFEAHGGDYARIEQAHDLVMTRVRERRTKVSSHYFWSEMDKLREASRESGNIPVEIAEAISALVRRSSPWGRIKEDGWRGLLDSGSIKAFRAISKEAADFGLFINPEGELESLCRSISRSSKAKWLSEVLVKDMNVDPDLEMGRDLVDGLREYMKENFSGLF